jgi:ribonuclease-3
MLITRPDPDHNKQFVSDVILENNVIGTGKGKSKKSAQQHAAKQALDKVS